MSNIIKSDNEFLVLNDFLNNKISFEETLKELLPTKNNELLIKYKIKNKGKYIAIFVPQYKTIEFTSDKVNKCLDEQANDFLEDLKSHDYKALRDYLSVFMITHEIEHSYQYLMGEGIVESPNDILKNAYKGLYDLMIHKQYILPRPISKLKKFYHMYLYKKNENFYLLERNANVESMDLVSKFALFNNRDDLFELFNDMRNTILLCGYQNSNMGSIEETYRKLLIYNKYKKFYHEIDLSFEERIRYGFGISEEETKILRK